MGGVIVTMTNTLIDASQIKETITSFYNISEPLTCTFIRRSFNDHYLIETADCKYIVRVYLNNKYYINDIEDIEFELDLLLFLNSNDVPVSYPIRNKENKLLSNIEDNHEMRYLTLFSFAEGSPIKTKLDKKTALRLGSLIAKMHKTLNKYNNKNHRYHINLEFLINEPYELLQKSSEKYSLGDINSMFGEYKDYLLQNLQALSTNSESYGIIHGDLNPSNIHINHNGHITVFDFDHCAYGWRIHDLSVIKLCFENDTYEAILEGYLSTKGLSQLELNSIELYSQTLILRKFKDVLSMITITHDGLDGNFNEKDYIKQAIDKLHLLSTNHH